MAKFSEPLEIKGIHLTVNGQYTKGCKSSNCLEEDEYPEISIEEIRHNREEISSIISQEVEIEIEEKLKEILL